MGRFKREVINMNTEIIDLNLNGRNKHAREKVKIRLVSCLQCGMNRSGENFFYKSPSGYAVTIETARKITCIVHSYCLDENGGLLDLIVVDSNVYLGYWNDGVI